MKDQQENFRIKSNYISDSPCKRNSRKYKISRKDRAIAVDLISEIHRKYGLVTETLFVAVSTLDRYLGLRKDPLRRSRDIEAIAIA
jgi:hypothetical protein